MYMYMCVYICYIYLSYFLYIYLIYLFYLTFTYIYIYLFITYFILLFLVVLQNFQCTFTTSPSLLSNYTVSLHRQYKYLITTK